MITNWPGDSNVWALAPVVTAICCGLVLKLTRRRLPPEDPRWRVWRAIIICAAMSVWPAIERMTKPRIGDGHPMFTFQEGYERATLNLVAALLGGGVMLGWLIPWLIEGRSLAAMGWVRRRAGWFLAGGLALSAVLGTLAAPRGALGLLELVPISLIASCAITGLLAGWSEENVFRGHLMLALVERGFSPRLANVLQAIVFALYHVPARTAGARLVGNHATVREMAVDVVTFFLSIVIFRFVCGLVFGLLRLRTRSIVPGFALHAGHNALRFMLISGLVVALGAE